MDVSDSIGKLIEIWPSWFTIIGVVMLNLWYYGKVRRCRKCLIC